MFKVIKLFFKGCWKILSGIRAVIANLVLLLIIVVIFSAIASAPTPQTAKNSALVVAPSGILVDQLTYSASPIDLINPPEDQAPETLLQDQIKAIEYAKKDPEITGIILQLDYLQGGGISKLEELGQALIDFKSSNKPVIAVADSYTQQQYFLATYADDIYINNFGSIFLTGYGVYRNYLKEAIDKLSLKFHVFRVGDFKDAIEPFARTDMSDASRTHNSVWLSQLWERYTSTVEANRSLSKGSINTYIDQMNVSLQALNGDSATLAKNAKLVDGVLSRTAYYDILIEEFGANKKNRVRSINTKNYLASKLELPKSNKKNIGLIVASGTILDGYQGNGAIGSDSFSDLIEQARKDKSLDALIVRIDSGGGSAFASEVIRDEIIKTKQGGLPVYISMGSMAASGGYWIATAGDEIWATPTTLTGSIGVWGLIPNFTDSMNRLGVYSDGVGTTVLADAMHPERPMTPQAQQIIQSSVEHIYNEFITLVATARNSTPESIHKIAQGRVWSGQNALELGLVDQLGSLNDLVQSIAKKRDLRNYAVKLIEPELTIEEKLIRSIMEGVSVSGQDLVHHSLTKNNTALSTIAALSSQLNILKPELDLIQKTAQNKKTPSILAQCTECALY